MKDLYTRLDPIHPHKKRHCNEGIKDIPKSDCLETDETYRFTDPSMLPAAMKAAMIAHTSCQVKKSHYNDKRLMIRFAVLVDILDDFLALLNQPFMNCFLQMYTVVVFLSNFGGERKLTAAIKKLVNYMEDNAKKGSGSVEELEIGIG